MRDPEMKKTPSALKRLAEKRARVAGDLQQMEPVLVEVQRRVATLREDLRALDRAITVYDPAINPQGIDPINAWKGNYGARGALRQAIARLLEAQSPEFMSTENLEVVLMAEFNIVFETAALRYRWKRNSLLSALKTLVVAGHVERLHDLHNQDMGRWRWKQEKEPTLAELRQTDAELVSC